MSRRIVMAKMDDNIIYRFHRIAETEKYTKILAESNPDKISNDLLYIFDTIPIMMETVMSNQNNITDLNKIDRNIDDLYYSAKAMANLVNFIKVMKPLCSRFNPSDEDKAKFVEYVKKMEENDNE
jgi:hypothetical protein